MSAQRGIGPVMAPRWKIYAQARELAQLAQLAIECAQVGPREDLPRARATIDRMRALLGVGDDE